MSRVQPEQSTADDDFDDALIGGEPLPTSHAEAAAHAVAAPTTAGSSAHDSEALAELVDADMASGASDHDATFVPGDALTAVPKSGALVSQQLSGLITQKAIEHVLPDASPQVQQAVKQLVGPWVAKYVRFLDDAVKIPGTNIGIGLDSLVGFVIPGAGDVATGVGSLALLYAGLKARVPTIVLLRMVANIGLDVVGGVVPILGDAFDVLWRSNRRNLELIEKYGGGSTAKPGIADYAVVFSGVLFALASIVIPIAILAVTGMTGIAAILALFGWSLSR